MSWFSWFDAGPEEKAIEEKDELWQSGLENPSVTEPLEDIAEVSSGAESMSVSSAAREKRRTIREIRTYVSESMQEREDKMFRSQSSEDYNKREAYRVADEALSSSQDTGIALNSIGTKEQSTSLADSNDEEEEGEIDLELVEEYDHAFNEFIAAHPQFVVISPDVVHSLRVCKLQKLLERGSSIEAELQDQLKQIEKSKGRMEVAYQRELKEASRKKAAREVHLASKLAATQKVTTAMEAKLLWKLVSSYEASYKKNYKLREKLKNASVENNNQGLLEILPKGAEFQSIRDAMLVPPSSEPLSEEQREDIKQFQIDNAFLHSEVAMLQKKLKHVKAATKKHAWVESLLVRMDPKVLNTLKQKYAKSKGVSL